MKAPLNAVVSLLFVLFVSATLVLAQTNSVDLTYNPVPSVPISSADTNGMGMLVQPDGKIVIWGGNFAIDGVARGAVARLNVDGTLDNSFAFCNCIDTVASVAVQPDGRLVVIGSIKTSTNIGLSAKVVRLNPNGSQDSSFFNSDLWNSGFRSFGTFVTVQTDGRILVSVSGSYCCGFSGWELFRLNTDGSRDSGFATVANDLNHPIGDLAIDPASGKIYLANNSFGGGTFSGSVSRYNTNGTADNTFEAPTFAPSTGSQIRGLALQSDGGLLISGRFDSVNGAPKRDVVRILPAGNADLNFTAPQLGSSYGQLAVLQNGKILAAYYVGTTDTRPVRLNADGSVDNSFTLSPSVQSVAGRFALDAMERVLFLGFSDRSEFRYFRLNPNGDRDTSFNPNVSLFGKVNPLARQADGKVVVAVKSSELFGVVRTTLARFNPDGTPDPTIDSGTGFNTPPRYLLSQADGKIIAVAGFSSYRGEARPGLARILADGNIDTAFSPTITENGFVNAAALQSDGKILIVGAFTSVNGEARTNAARLNADGSLDSSFNPTFGVSNLTDILQQPDGKIMVAGSFSGVNGFNRSNLVRLTTTGELDQSFNANGAIVERVWLQPNGKYLLTNVTVSHRNVDGSVDTSFVSPTFDVTDSSSRRINSVVVQSDGSLIVGGRFDKIGAVVRRNIVRLSSTGGLDQLFLPIGADAEVKAMVAQPDGKVITGGDFSKIEHISRAGVARLNISVLRRATPFDFDGDGRADISVLRSSTNRWYEVYSSTGVPYEETFGLAGDILTPSDYDGDGVTDESIFRPSNGQFWYRSSLNGALIAQPWGISGDIPRPSDFDGDGKTDFVVFRPSNSTWYRLATTGFQSSTQFGLPGDQPLVGDFDGDGKGDLAVFRPSNGDWWYAASSAGGAFRTVHWGQNGDIPVPADFDGDGKTDYAVYRPSEGGWYIYNSGNGSFITMAFGLNGDRPVAADYDGDGRADIAVFRPSTGIWYLLQSTSGFLGYQFGISTDTAIPGSLIP